MNDISEYRVLVTSTSYGMNDPSLRAELESQVKEVIYNPAGHPLTPEELIALIPEIDGMIAGLDFITREVIEAAPRLKVIARYGVGLDRVDLDAAREKQIIVTYTPAANASSVAELTIGLMLALCRNIPYANMKTKAGEWPRLRGTSISGKTVGLLGLGAIGSRVAQMLGGFDCKIVAYDPHVTIEEAKTLGVDWLEKDTVIQSADILSLHLPATHETENMIDASVFSTMKDGSFLINTARSELIDEKALLEALENNKLAGAALDTFREEPPKNDYPLFKLNQVIATPHTGSHTDTATNVMGRMALENCLAVLRGKEPVHPVK